MKALRLVGRPADVLRESKKERMFAAWPRPVLVARVTMVEHVRPGIWRFGITPMKYERFEDLPVWKAAEDLAERVYGLTRDRAFSEPGDLRDQLRRAALSVSNNIAEGFEPGTTAELRMFLDIARGSAGEVRSMLHLYDRLPESSNLKSEISDLRSLAECCSRQLRAWADSLQNMDIQGQRHLNDRSRKVYEYQRGSAALWRQLEADQRCRVEEWSHGMGVHRGAALPSDPPGEPEAR